MCVILDANMMSRYVKNKDKDIKPLRKRVESKKIKLVYPPEKSRLHSEYQWNPDFNLLLTEYRTEGIVAIISRSKYNQAEKELQNKKKQKKVVFKSNEEDFSVLVSAKAAKANLLATNDGNLEKDFTNHKIIGGKVYKRYRDHKHLLDENNCPN